MFNFATVFNSDSKRPVVGSASTLIECSATELFQYIGEDLFHNYPKWSKEVKELEQVTPGPVQLATIGRQIRVDQGRRTESEFKVSAYEPGERLTFIGLSDPFLCSYEFQAIDPEKLTKLTFTFELIELLPIMRPFESLVRAAIKDGAKRTVHNIKHLVETERPVPISPNAQRDFKINSIERTVMAFR